MAEPIKRPTRKDFIMFVSGLKSSKKNISWQYEDGNLYYSFTARRTINHRPKCPICRMDDNIIKRLKCKNNSSYFSCQNCSLRIHINQSRWRKFLFALKNLLPSKEIIYLDAAKLPSYINKHNFHCIVCGTKLAIKPTENVKNYHFFCHACKMHGFVPNEHLMKFLQGKSSVKY